MNTATQLPENPTILLVGTITNINSTSQAVNDVTIASVAGASRKLDDMSRSASHNSQINTVAQITNETLAATDEAGAARANNADAALALEVGAQMHDIAAGTYNVKANSEAAVADATGAQAASLEESSRIQTIVAEVTQMKETGIKEVEIMTQEGIKQGMRVAGAVHEDEERKALDLEQQARMTASVSADSPKLA